MIVEIQHQGSRCYFAQSSLELTYQTIQLGFDAQNVNQRGTLWTLPSITASAWERLSYGARCLPKQRNVRTTMVGKKTKSDPRETRKEVNEKVSNEKVSNEQVNFDKALGSSRNDRADLRDVARKAAKKSQ